MALKYEMESFEQLLYLIANGNPDEYAPGPKLVEARIWDGRTVTASYSDLQEADIETNLDFFADAEPLRPFVEKLLKEGKSFIMCTGESDMVGFFIWEIDEAA